MIRITTPTHQFFRLSDQHLDDPDWMESQLPGTSLGFVLPVAAADDIAFQMLVTTDTSEEADTVCDFPLPALLVGAYPGTSLGPAFTIAEMLSIPATVASASDLGVERYRISDTEVLFYFPQISLGELPCNVCFQVGIGFYGHDVDIAAISNVFRHVCDNTDYTTVLDYSSLQDEAGFIYCVAPSIKTRIRLPLYLTRPTYPEEQTEHRLSSGAVVIPKAVVREVYEVITDLMPGWAVKALRAIWLHDDVIVDESPSYPQVLPYKGEIVKEGAFEPGWVEYMNFPLGQPRFKVAASPFLMRKNNCGECVDYSDLLTVSDHVIASITPNTTYTIDLADFTDAGCCSPLSYAVDYYQTNYIETIGIVGTTLTIHTRSAYLILVPPPFARIKVMCGGIIKYINITVFE